MILVNISSSWYKFAHFSEHFVQRGDTDPRLLYRIGVRTAGAKNVRKRSSLKSRHFKTNKIKL